MSGCLFFIRDLSRYSDYSLSKVARLREMSYIIHISQSNRYNTTMQ